MKLSGDYHNHTIYSKFNHGKGSIMQNVLSAKEQGFAEIAITDHGPRHLFYGVRKKCVPQIIKEIEEARQASGITVYFGMETNLMGVNGEIDTTPELLKDLQVVAMGYHRGSWMNFKNTIKMRLGNIFLSKAKRKEINTNAYIRAIENNNIDFVTHLKQYIDVDCGRIAEVASKKGTFIEINNRHLKLTKSDVEDMLKTDVKFIVNSDAHRPENVGKVDTALKFVEDMQIPHDRIVNIDGKTPQFLSHKLKDKQN